jgi:hypothetical protein
MKNVAISLVVFVVAAVASRAQSLTYTGTGSGNNTGQTLNAAVTFTVSNLDLIVTLSNTATFDANDAPDILTSLFFSIAGDPKLIPVSADLAPDSTLLGRHVPAGFDGDVGPEWAYRNNLLKAPLGADEGISSTSLKWFSKKYHFPGETIRGAGPLSGIHFGLTTLDDLPTNNRSNIKNQNLIQDTVVFTFTGLPVDFDLSEIADVSFHYGTALKPPDLAAEIPTTVSEPSTIALVAVGLLGALAGFRRKIARPFDSTSP